MGTVNERTNVECIGAVPDLPLCLGVLKHRATLARVGWGGGGGGGGHIPAIFFNFYDRFLLMWCNFKFEGVLFRRDSRHNDRVDSLWECATKQAVMASFRAQVMNLITTSTGPHLS